MRGLFRSWSGCVDVDVVVVVVNGDGDANGNALMSTSSDRR
jgi:hypothetical protein